MRNKGITLIALVITIIILLILAGLSISAITGSGLFGKTSNATNKYNQAKARETLELVLEEAFIQKYDEGLTDEQLTNKINEIGEEIPKEDENSNKQQVIVDGYIFEIDRSVPKIIDELGKAEGIVITARVSNNDTEGWVSESESKANITGTIKTYSGGKIKISNAKIESATIPFSIDSEGNYIIENITDSGIYTIYAEDSKGKSKTKEIEVTVKVDKTAPTVETVIAAEEGNKIKISAIGYDKDVNGEEQSGIKEFNYTITPTDGVNKASGTFRKNEAAEITVTNWVLYTIKVTATDKCQNTTRMENAKEQTVDLRDTTSPEIKTAEAKASKYTIKVKAVAEDSKSGLASLRYSITPTTGLPTGKNEGDLPQNGQEVTITSTAIATYTVTITATDNAGNLATKTMSGIETSDVMSVEDVKETVNSSNIKNYIGEKVDYRPTAGGTWRIFYQDNEEGKDGKGYFGCGKGMIFLKRDYDSSKQMILTLSSKTSNTDPAVAMMRKMNPMWAASSAHNSIDQNNEKGCVWLCDDTVWKDYRTSNSSFAIGSPSIEMYAKAYNQWKESNSAFVYKLDSTSVHRGYLIGTNNSFSFDSGYRTADNSIQTGPGNIFRETSSSWWLCSPAAIGVSCVFYPEYGRAKVESSGGIQMNRFGVCPLVPLDQ